MSLSPGAVPLNKTPGDPEIDDLLRLVKRDIFLNMNVHHVGTVETFNPLLQTATASINYQKQISVLQPDGETYQPTLVAYPVLLDCPVIFAGGGTGALTFPVESGDECLILFNDRAFDTWLTQGETDAAPPSARAHSFSDGIILVGLRSQPNVLVDFATDATELRTVDGTVKVSVAPDAVKIVKGATTVTVEDDTVTAEVGPTMTLKIDASGSVSITNGTGELLQSLLQLLNDIATGTTPTMLGPELLVMPTWTTDLQKFQSFVGEGFVGPLQQKEQ